MFGEGGTGRTPGEPHHGYLSMSHIELVIIIVSSA